MSAPCLIIVVSNDLADVHANEPQEFNGTDLLILPKELDGKPGVEGISGVEQHWEPILKARIRKILGELRPETQCVRVAVHRRCINKGEAVELRYFAGEGDLRKDNHIVDIKVLGFRHDFGKVPVWRILYKLKPIIKRLKSGESALQPEAEELVRKLHEAFREWHAGGLRLTLKDCRSAVLSRLDSIIQELQLLKEKREAGRESLQANPERISSHHEYAQKQLTQYKDFLRSNDPIIFGRLEPSLNTLSDSLTNVPKTSTQMLTTQDVNQWIDEIQKWKVQLKIEFDQVERDLAIP